MTTVQHLFSKRHTRSAAFTIVELTVVIAVIAILATIVTIAYRGVQSQAVETAMKSDLTTNVNLMDKYFSSNGEYPMTASAVDSGSGLKTSGKGTMTYVPSADYRSYCLQSVQKDSEFFVTSANHDPQPGTCSGSIGVPPYPPTGVIATVGGSGVTVSWTEPMNTGGTSLTGYTAISSPGSITATVSGGTTTATVTGLTSGVSYSFTVKAINAKGASIASAPSNTVVAPLVIADGVPIQLITSSNCPTTRTRAVDARDNHTYWVQKLADGKCWMLTNLAYAGGGTNTYTDTKSLTNGTGGSITYTAASYYVPASGANVTSEPTNPSTSTSTDGTGQYGYLYNWCGAMGAQANTSACLSTATPALSSNISICPAGWRVPTGGSGGEYSAMNTAIGGSFTNTGPLQSIWLAQLGSSWYNGFTTPTSEGDRYYSYYWSSTPFSPGDAYYFLYYAGQISSSNHIGRNYGFAVRCIAS